MTRTAARQIVISILLRSISDITDFVRLLEDAGWGSLAGELRQRQASRPAITGAPKIDPEIWKRGLR
jgi:hypothetical protein